MRLAMPLVFIIAAGCASAPGAGPDAAGATKPLRAIAFKPSDVENRTAAELDALFGPPALTRVEGAGEFRRYAFAACSLIVILYPDNTGVSRVAHSNASALKSGDSDPTLIDCLASGLAAS